MNFDKPFWKNVLRESDGTPSSSRLYLGLIVLFPLFWVSYIVVKTISIPNLSPVEAFISGGALATYGVNRLASSGISIFGKSEPKVPTE